MWSGCKGLRLRSPNAIIDLKEMWGTIVWWLCACVLIERQWSEDHN